MTAYLTCTVTREGVSAVYLRDDDAVAAAGSSELLDVDTFLADTACFPPRQGLPRGIIRDIHWAGEWRARLRLLEAEFHTMCQT